MNQNRRDCGCMLLFISFVLIGFSLVTLIFVLTSYHYYSNLISNQELCKVTRYEIIDNPCQDVWLYSWTGYIIYCYKNLNVTYCTKSIYPVCGSHKNTLLNELEKTNPLNSTITCWFWDGNPYYISFNNFDDWKTLAIVFGAMMSVSVIICIISLILLCYKRRSGIFI